MHYVQISTSTQEMSWRRLPTSSNEKLFRKAFPFDRSSKAKVGWVIAVTDAVREGFAQIKNQNGLFETEKDCISCFWNHDKSNY